VKQYYSRIDFKLCYNFNNLVQLFKIYLFVLIYRGESARKDSIAGPEVLAQQQAVMAAVEAEIKQKNSVENPSAFSTVLKHCTIAISAYFFLLD